MLDGAASMLLFSGERNDYVAAAVASLIRIRSASGISFMKFSEGAPARARALWDR
jgi:hypothetical protein